MKCIACASSDVENLGGVGRKEISITSDTKLCNLSARIYHCNNCGHLQKSHSPEEKKAIERLYELYEPHHLSDGNEPLVYVESGDPVPRSFYVLQKCLPWIKKEKGVLLDIGTGNGNVLRSAQKLFNGWNLKAFDIADTYKNEILTLPNVSQFYSGDIYGIDDRFDVVTMWHSLEHITDLPRALCHIKKLIAASGILIIQVPDIIRNPFDLCVIDHCSHFSLDTLKQVLEMSGFHIAANGCDWIYNCLTLVAIPEPHPRLKSHALPGNSLKPILNYLNEILNIFDKETDGKSFLIFGTGNASICVYSQLAQKPDYFIDEDPRKNGKKIDGVMITPPGKISPGTLVVLPFFEDDSRRLIAKLTDMNNLNPFEYKFIDIKSIDRS